MGLYSLFTTGDIMNREFCFKKLVYDLDPLDFEAYNKSNVEFYAVVTNLETGNAEYIEIKDAQKDMVAYANKGDDEGHAKAKKAYLEAKALYENHPVVKNFETAKEDLEPLLVQVASLINERKE